MSAFQMQVSDDIVDMVVLVSEHLSRPFEERFKDDFTALQIYTMCKLAMDGPMTMTELADAMHITKQQMTKVIARLSDQGYISRHHDEKDKRIIVSEISQKTLEYIKLRREYYSEYVKKMLSKLGEEEIEELSDAIRKINKIMHKLSEMDKETDI